MSNATTYLDAFSMIERHLRELTDAGRDRPFVALVDSAAATDSLVRRYRDDLKEFASLRNAIVHERGGGEVIAEPNDWAVRTISHIAEQLMRPPCVLPAFGAAVLTLQIDAAISEAVAAMHANSFSQIPIYEGGRFAGLLHSNTVTRWLGASVRDDLVSLRSTSIRQVLAHTEHADHVTFVGRTTTLADVAELFVAYDARGRHLDALLITNSGQRTEKLLGIITVHDLADIHTRLAP